MNPLISVVIPCRNEVKSIAATIGALLQSTYNNIEILVVDGQSDDGTRDLVASLRSQDARVRLIDNPRQLTPYAFNLGVKEARGEFVQIVGARNRLAPDYIETLHSFLLENPEVACVGGDFQHVYDSPQGRWISLAMESKFGMGSGNYRTMSDDADVDTVGIPLYRKAIFSEVGLFDETLTRNQDDEFNFRLRKGGQKIRYHHRAKATYLVRGDLKKACAQFFQYGYFKVFVSRKHGQLTTLRQVVPVAFVTFFWASIPVVALFPKLIIVPGLVAASYLGLGWIMVGRGLGLQDKFRVIYTCLRLHWAYGSGYALGIWDFVLAKRSPRLTLQRQTT